MALSHTASRMEPSTSSPTATVRPIPAFTTPYAQPTDCDSVVTTTVTTVVSYSDLWGTGSFSTVLLPDTSHPRYAACFDPAGASQFSFSPAVCPLGWPASWVGQTPVLGLSSTRAPSSYNGTAYANVSTAYCCPQDYSMSFPGGHEQPSPSCLKPFISAGTGISGSGRWMLRTTSTIGVVVVPAWHISWQTTDVLTLSPQPPTLDGTGIITSWRPGSDIPSGGSSGSGSSGSGSSGDNCCQALGDPRFWFLVVGVPGLFVAFFIGGICVYPAWLRRRSLREARRPGE